MSRARERPIKAGRRYVPPAPGRMARRVSGRATVVVDAKTRMCVVRASSRPPPKAGAAKAEIVGMGNCDIDANVPRSVVRKLDVLPSVSRRSSHVTVEETRHTLPG